MRASLDSSPWLKYVVRGTAFSNAHFPRPWVVSPVRYLIKIRVVASGPPCTSDLSLSKPHCPIVCQISDTLVFSFSSMEAVPMGWQACTLGASPPSIRSRFPDSVLEV
jgi:hypothetical protein